MGACLHREITTVAVPIPHKLELFDQFSIENLIRALRKLETVLADDAHRPPSERLVKMSYVREDIDVATGEKVQITVTDPDHELQGILETLRHIKSTRPDRATVKTQIDRAGFFVLANLHLLRKLKLQFRQKVNINDFTTMSPPLSVEQRREIVALFERINTSQSGAINLAEFDAWVSRDCETVGDSVYLPLIFDLVPVARREHMRVSEFVHFFDRFCVMGEVELLRFAFFQLATVGKEPGELPRIVVSTLKDRFFEFNEASKNPNNVNRPLLQELAKYALQSKRDLKKTRREIELIDSYASYDLINFNKFKEIHELSGLCNFSLMYMHKKLQRTLFGERWWERRRHQVRFDRRQTKGDVTIGESKLGISSADPDLYRFSKRDFAVGSGAPKASVDTSLSDQPDSSAPDRGAPPLRAVTIGGGPGGEGESKAAPHRSKSGHSHGKHRHRGGSGSDDDDGDGSGGGRRSGSSSHVSKKASHRRVSPDKPPDSAPGSEAAAAAVAAAAAAQAAAVAAAAVPMPAPMMSPGGIAPQLGPSPSLPVMPVPGVGGAPLGSPLAGPYPPFQMSQSFGGGEADRMRLAAAAAALAQSSRMPLPQPMYATGAGGGGGGGAAYSIGLGPTLDGGGGYAGSSGAILAAPGSGLGGASTPDLRRVATEHTVGSGSSSKHHRHHKHHKKHKKHKKHKDHDREGHGHHHRHRSHSRGHKHKHGHRSEGGGGGGGAASGGVAGAALPSAHAGPAPAGAGGYDTSGGYAGYDVSAGAAVGAHGYEAGAGVGGYGASNGGYDAGGGGAAYGGGYSNGYGDGSGGGGGADYYGGGGYDGAGGHGAGGDGSYGAPATAQSQGGFDYNQGYAPVATGGGADGSYGGGGY